MPDPEIPPQDFPVQTPEIDPSNTPEEAPAQEPNLPDDGRPMDPGVAPEGV